MKAKRIAVIAAVLVLLVGLRLYRSYVTRNLVRQQGTVTADYVFDGHKTARVVFHLGHDPRAVVALSDGRTLSLKQGPSGSGARYVNENESIVFWIKGDTASLEEGGRETYANGRQVRGDGAGS